MQKSVVVIPVYKTKPSAHEKMAFVQCCKILKKHPFLLIFPEGLDISSYKALLKKHKIEYATDGFPAEYFSSVEKYNELMLNKDFYQRFSEFEYMLIYQLDAYVFHDKLKYWCEQGFDYIGAPWFEGYDNGTDNSKALDVAGNGGFSLRKIASFIDVLDDNSGAYADFRQNEDIFFSIYGPKINNNFKVASPDIASRFSFECQPRKLYQMTGEKLPFGCHAWERYDPEFWNEFIAKPIGLRIKSAIAKIKPRATLMMGKLAGVFIPVGSSRRKSAVKFWRFIKLLAKVARNLKPRKHRKINLQSKKIAFIGHSYHKKTLSSDFFLDYLRQFYEVEMIFDESWIGGAFPDLSFIDDEYLAVIFWQNLPERKILESIKNDNLIFVPMYDTVITLNFDFLDTFQDLKIINFSKTLHTKLAKFRFDSLYVQYFPEPQEFIAGNKKEVFFWQRLTRININTIVKLFGKEDLKIHIHKGIDPGQEFVQPNPEDEKKFQITYSDWFESRQEMWLKMEGVIKQRGIYIAPREFEGIGLSFLEAMAMGKAVIAVDNPTMNEYIEHRKTGYLFDLSKPEELDLSGIEQVQKNTHEFMRQGYEKWQQDRHKIIDFIKQ